MVHFESQSNVNSILNLLSFGISSGKCILRTDSGALTNLTDSFLMFTRLLKVFVGSFAWGGG